MKRSRRELFIDMVIHKGIFENEHVTLYPSFTLPKTGVSFCRVRKIKLKEESNGGWPQDQYFKYK